MRASCILIATATCIVISVSAIAEDEDNLPENINIIVDEASNNETEVVGGSWTPGIESWLPDPGMRDELFQDHRWYIAGYDYDKRPVIVWELGRSKVIKYVEGGTVSKEMLYQYTEWKWYTISKIQSPDTGADDGIFLIVDTSEFHASELASFEGVKINVFCSRMVERIEAQLAKVIFINVSFVGQTWINIVKPVGGRWLGKAEIFGPLKEKWQPVLAQYIPKDQLPPFYGGSLGNDYKPVQIYG